MEKPKNGIKRPADQDPAAEATAPPAERMSFENRIAWLENAIERTSAAHVASLGRFETAIVQCQVQTEQLKVAIDAVLVERATIKALIQKVIS